jgi:hypothetical protein
MASNITDNEGLIVYEVISDSTKTTAQLMAGASTAHTQLIQGTLIDRVSDNEAKLDLLKPTDTVVFDTVNATTAITVPSLQLTGGIGPQGTMTWNADEETVDLVQNGNTLPIGQAQEYHVRNATGSTITKGKVVMATGTIGNSGRITAAPMDGTALANTKYMLGIAAEDILAGEDGKVSSFGKVKGVNTLGALSFGGLETWTDANILYIDTINSGGYLTNVRPTIGMVVPIAIVIHAHTSGTLFSRTVPVNEDYYTTGEVDNLVGTKMTKVTSTDNAIVRFDGVTGEVQDSLVTVDDLGIMQHGLVWKDLVAPFTTASLGAAAPALTTLPNGVRLNKFGAGDSMHVSYHVDHDYAEGTLAYHHIHWFPETAMTAGDTVTWRVHYIVARGHNQGDSLTGARSSFDVTYTSPAGGTIAGDHIVSEASLAQAYSLVEPDTVILAEVELLSKTYGGNVYGVQADLHYQADVEGTIGKRPDFRVAD